MTAIDRINKSISNMRFILALLARARKLSFNSDHVRVVARFVRDTFSDLPVDYRGRFSNEFFVYVQPMPGALDGGLLYKHNPANSDSASQNIFENGCTQTTADATLVLHELKDRRREFWRQQTVDVDQLDTAMEQLELLNLELDETKDVLTTGACDVDTLLRWDDVWRQIKLPLSTV